MKCKIRGGSVLPLDVLTLQKKNQFYKPSGDFTQGLL